MSASDANFFPKKLGFRSGGWMCAFSGHTGVCKCRRLSRVGVNLKAVSAPIYSPQCSEFCGFYQHALCHIASFIMHVNFFILHERNIVRMFVGTWECDYHSMGGGMGFSIFIIIHVLALHYG